MSVSVEMSFLLGNYQNIVQEMRNTGYEIHNFETAQANKKHLVLRHDIDLSPQYALKMARFEADMNVSATYFFLLRDRAYNLFCPENVRILHDILKMGHNIGLHFDASLYNQDVKDIDRFAAMECAWLEDVIEQDVKVISFHRPAKGLYGYDALIAGRVHAYQSKFFHDMEYCSDSRGAWHHGHPLKRPMTGGFQLLTHPIWWVSEEEKSAKEILEAHINTVNEETKNFLQSTYCV